MYESFAKAPPLLNQEWRLCRHNVEKYKFVRANTLQKEITNVHSEAFQIKSRYGEESFTVARVLKNRKRNKKLIIMYLTKMEIKLVLFI